MKYKPMNLYINNNIRGNEATERIQKNTIQKKNLKVLSEYRLKTEKNRFYRVNFGLKI